jgi:hypothetical protein
MSRAQCPHAFSAGQVHCRSCGWTPDAETQRQVLAISARPLRVLPVSWWPNGRPPVAMAVPR